MEICAEAPSKRQIKLYINPDKNNKQKALERVEKMLYDVVQDEVDTSLDTNLVRNVAMVCVDWLPLMRVEAKAENEFQPWWNDLQVEELKFNKRKIVGNLAAKIGAIRVPRNQRSSGGEAWSQGQCL